MQKEKRDACLASQRKENGFIVRSGKSIYRRISVNPNVFHNEIALEIINEDKKLKRNYQKSKFKGQPAVFLVNETPAIMIASGMSKVISYNPSKIKGDKCLEREVDKYKGKGFTELNIFF